MAASLASCVTVPPAKVCIDNVLYLDGVLSGQCLGEEDMPYNSDGEPDFSFFESLEG